MYTHHTCIGIYSAYCITACLHTHSHTEREGETCTLAEWNEKFVDCHFNVFVYLFLFCRVKMMRSAEGFYENLIDIDSKCTASDSSMSRLQVTGNGRESEICTCNAYYSIATSFIRRRSTDMLKCAVWQIITMHFQQANKQTNKQILQIKQNKDVSHRKCTHTCT